MRVVRLGVMALVLMICTGWLLAQAPAAPTNVHVAAALQSGGPCSRTAASVSRADVTASIAAASDGDVVCVPAGTATWSSAYSFSKSITLRGAGIGQTVINSGVNNINAYLLNFSPTSAAANLPVEITGFTFDGHNANGLLQIESGSSTIALTKIKVHHNRFVNAHSRAIGMPGLEFGVFHHNQFEHNYISISTLFAEMAGWNYALTLGGANYPYFEDNTFVGGDGGFISEAGRGGRIVFRHNSITGYGGSGAEVWDMHGVNSVYPSDNGTVSAEFYNNTIALTASSRVLFHRGGKGLIFNNTVTGSSGYMQMTEYQGWSYCTGAGYPKPEQINESFYFNNTTSGSPMTPALFCPSGGCSSCGQYDSTYIQLNRDYFTPTSGTAAARPGTCTTNSYYGATDTGVISKCVSTNTWSTYYTPYTYPHPLQ